MRNANLSDEPMDAWLVDASRRLDAPSGDVARLISSIVGGLPQLRRPSRQLDTDDPLVRIDDRVIRQLLATRIRAESGRLVVRLDLHGEGAELTGVGIGLIARYRDDLQERGQVVREAAQAVLTEALGRSASAAACADVHVRWQDVYTREWLD